MKTNGFSYTRGLSIKDVADAAERLGGIVKPHPTKDAHLLIAPEGYQWVNSKETEEFLPNHMNPSRYQKFLRSVLENIEKGIEPFVPDQKHTQRWKRKRSFA